MSSYADYDPRDMDPRDCPRGERPKVQLPAFNVCVPFQRITMVQMNLAMRDVLSDFFHELVDEEAEEEIVGFRDALDDPSVYVHATRPNEPSFLMCEKYMNVIVVEMNEAMRDLIRKFINEIEGRIEDEIWAFNRALENPEASREIREQKQSGRFARKAEPEAPAPPPSKIRRRKLTTQPSFE